MFTHAQHELQEIHALLTTKILWLHTTWVCLQCCIRIIHIPVCTCNCCEL